MNSLNLFKGLPRDILFLFLARVVTSIGNFVFPFLTLILTDKLGMTSRQAGDILLLSTISFLPGTLIGGKLADLMGRKKIVIISQALFASSYVLCGAAANSAVLPYLIIPANICMGATFPALQALTMDLTPRHQRQAAFSLLYLGHNIGLAVGPFIAGFLFNTHFRLIFFGDAATTYLSVVLLLIFVHERVTVPGDEQESGSDAPATEKAEPGSVLDVLRRRPYLVLFILIAMILNFVYAQHTFSLPIFLNELFADTGPRYYGFIMTCNALVVIFCTAPAVALTRRLNPVYNLCVVSALYAVGFGMIFFLSRLPLFFIATIIWTTGEILATTNKQVYIADHTPVSHRGRLNALLPVTSGIAFAISPPLMGRFIESTSARMVWLLAGAMAIAGLAGFLLLLKLHAPEKKSLS
jgi:MFS family permease